MGRTCNLLKKSRLLTASLVGISLLSSVYAGEVKLDGTAAVVNSGIILESELNAATAQVQAGYRSSGASIDDITARRLALSELITRTLILQLAKNQGHDLNDMQIDSSLKQIAIRNNTTVDKVLQRYGLANGVAYAREKFKEDYLINQVRRATVRNLIHISEAEVETLAKSLQKRGAIEPSYHLAQVIVPLSSSPNEAEYRRAKANADAAIAAIRKGGNIEEIAAKYSNAGDRTDLGYVPETSVPLPFLPAIVAAKKGDVVGPFRSAIGFHIFKVYDISTSAIAPVTTYKASHILIKTSIVFSDEAAVAKLNSILNDINSGATTFAKAAREFSEDTNSAKDGGNMGYVSLDILDPEFAQELSVMKPGTISGPVKSSFGWHLIYLADKKTDNDSLDVYKQRARGIILERDYAEALKNWERSIRESAYIHINDSALREAYLKAKAAEDSGINTAK